MPTTATMPEPPRGNASFPRLQPGARLGNYRLVATIGAGGMANVWAAARTGDYGFERLFAVKVMRDEIANEASFRKMFLDEAKVSARIHHTNVVDVIDLGEDGGTVYQVMPLVEGDSLARLLHAMSESDPAAKVPRSVATRIVVDTLRGLHAAHETRGGRDGDGPPLGIVHRDVSPQNILVGIDGVSKIADFGVAKVTASLAEETERGAPKGKISYMSPEQLAKADVDRRSDLFSTGVVLWELLAGVRLTPTAATRALAREAIASPLAVDPSIPEPLAAIAMHALAADARDRFETADAMADALEGAARACGLALSTKEVASWAAALATKTLTRRREQLTEALGTIAAAATVSEVPPKSALSGRGRSSSRIALAAGAFVVVAGALAVAMGARRSPATPADVAVSATSQGTHAPAVVPSTEPVAAVASAPPPPAPSAAPVASSPPSSSPAAPRATKRAPRPKFENPYAR